MAHSLYSGALMMADKHAKTGPCLYIVGRFSFPAEDVPPHHIFQREQPASQFNGTLSAKEFFRVIRPSLSGPTSGTLTIGDTIFNSYDFRTPVTMTAQQASNV